MIPGPRPRTGQNAGVVSSPPLAYEEPRWQVVRRWLIVAVVAFVLFFYLLGGWYFSGQIRDEALAVQPPSERVYDLGVVAAGPDEVTLRMVADDDDPDLGRPGVFGLAWPGGYTRVGEIVGSGGGQVTRRVLDGPVPEPGMAADLDPYAFDGDPETALGIPFRDVIIDGPLGGLPAWWILGGSDTWAIHIHGKGASRQEALRAVPAVRRAGLPQLVISYRNDPDAPADPSGFYQYGRTEWEDLAAAVRFATDHGAKRVVLIGYSTGAAIAAAYMFHEDQALVAGAVFDAPNLDMAETIAYGASQRNLPFVPLRVPRSLAEVAMFFAGLRFDVNWNLLDYAKRGGQIRAPVLVFHGTEDDTVPIEVSRELVERQPNLVQLVEVPGAGHVESWNVDPEAYEARLVDFLRFELRR